MNDILGWTILGYLVYRFLRGFIEGWHNAWGKLRVPLPDKETTDE